MVVRSAGPLGAHRRESARGAVCCGHWGGLAPGQNIAIALLQSARPAACQMVLPGAQCTPRHMGHSAAPLARPAAPAILS